MTLKTDLKFGLLVILILGGVFLFVTKTIRSAPLSSTTLADKLHRGMSRVEVGKLVGTDLKTRWGMGQTLEANYTFPASNGNGQGVLFEFDVEERLQTVYVDQKDTTGRWTRTRLEIR